MSMQEFCTTYDSEYLIENLLRIKINVVIEDDVMLVRKKIMFVIMDLIRVYNNNKSLRPLNKNELRLVISSLFTCLVSITTEALHITLGNLIFEISRLRLLRQSEMCRNISECLPSCIIDMIGV